VKRSEPDGVRLLLWHPVCNFQQNGAAAERLQSGGHFPHQKLFEVIIFIDLQQVESSDAVTVLCH